MKWIIIHKGRLEEIDIRLLRHISKYFIPVYANDVFVIFSIHKELPELDRLSPHLQSYFEKAKRREDIKNRLLNLINHLKNRIRDIRRHIMISNIHVDENILLNRGKMENISRSNCQTLYLGEGTVLCRILAKYMLYVDSRDTGITPHLCLNGYWEPWITVALVRTIRSGWYCIDVGANCGYYSLIMADFIGSSGHVTAIEPNPRLATMLKWSLEVNGFQKQSSVMQKAVSDTIGKQVDLVIPEGRLMNATIRQNTINTTSDKIESVTTMTLDDLTKEWSHVDLIKIDAEGAEEAIWKGMLEMLRKNKNIIVIMEFNCLRYSDPRMFLQDIQKKGFPLRYIDYDTEIRELTIEKCLKDRIGEDWMLFLKRN